MSNFDFVSSSTLAGEVGITHKKLKELIRKNKVSVIPAGLQMVEGKSQRVVLVDRGNVEEIFTKSMKPLSRKASSKKKQK